MKCKRCPASGNFNGCPCYFGNNEKECKWLTKRKIIKMIEEAEEERDDNSDYASDYDFEIQLWEEMKQELLEDK